MSKEQNEKAKSLVALIKKPQVVERFKGLAQEHLSAERMLFLASECVRRNPALGECDHLSVLGAFITSHSLGLEPNTPLAHAFLIPYKGWTKDQNGKWVQKQAECNFQIGYRGFAQLFHRSGKVLTFSANAIRENDHFSAVEGTKMEVSYSKALTNRGKVVGSYCHINKINGGQDFELLELDEILKIRDTSETYKSLVKGVEQAKSGNKSELAKAEAKLSETPWVKWEDIMFAKPAIKRLAKISDLDSSVAMAAEIDSLSDVGKADFKMVAEASNRDEIFNAFSQQENKAVAPNTKAIPKMDLETMPVMQQSNNYSNAF